MTYARRTEEGALCLQGFAVNNAYRDDAYSTEKAASQSFKCSVLSIDSFLTGVFGVSRDIKISILAAPITSG